MNYFDKEELMKENFEKDNITKVDFNRAKDFEKTLG